MIVDAGYDMSLSATVLDEKLYQADMYSTASANENQTLTMTLSQ